ncbi:tyrosine-protein phosphatase YwqE [Clostridium tepidiprofundi DSM 19306]|uniref:protein-tyrosine-phosphatase n=1 Tax=Clostridium tepidiprofundi DSM 19306 TaxID=1121338 RepID=A0A151B2Y6_9CLOT|nr:CpsB/CapC family capsule biosynthesis tyrosine phosphatase [Clostridium tepidiprofundi]KYH34271.1 tyrosine-protein phosphatase YwqE [Clostridium tepidiprofundi DSM 19306]
MIDMHCHIIPGIDDGPKDIETSIEMLRIAERVGIKTIIATPHFYRNFYEIEYEEVIKRTIEMNNIVHGKGINIKILPGQEVFLDKHTVDLYEEGIIGGLNNSRYLLVELPFDKPPKYVLDIIYEFRIRNVVPVIAHPERYSYVIKKPSILNDFIEEGCLFQINAGSLLGKFGKNVYKTAKLLVNNEICDVIGSDAHSTKIRSPKLLAEATEMLKNRTIICENTVINSKIMTDNKTIISKHEKIKARIILFR